MALQTAGLSSQIWNNNLKSMLLLGLYPALLFGLFFACIYMGFLFMPAPADSQFADIHANALTQAKTYALQGAPWVFGAALLWFAFAYLFHGKMIRKLSHSRPVTRDEEPALYNLLENLCIARGIPMPRLEIIETHARNAFASGIDRNSYTVTLTRGLLRSLSQDEVEAVLAHELAHIIHRDVRLLIVSIIFTGMIGFAAQMVWSSMRYQLFFGGRRERRDARLMVVLFVIMLVLWVGYLATLFTRFALSRKREYMADAGAVEMTKNPEAMMRALQRISGRDRIPEATDDVALMCIENTSRFFGLFATHPPIDDRLSAISRFSGAPVPEMPQGARVAGKNRFESVSHQRANPWLTKERRQ